MKLLIINGPNLNLLGLREPEIYGHRDYAALTDYIAQVCHGEGIDFEVYQSNHEGDIVDKIQAAYGVFDGMVINAAAYTHTSIAIMDAVKAVGLPTVEVHLSDINAREGFRTFSYLGMACVKSYMGMGFEGYRAAILYLKERLEK